MKEYDYTQISEMQEKALARVRDMQLKAQEALQPQEVKPPEEKNYKDNFYKAVSAPAKSGYIRMPVEMPPQVKPYSSFNEYFEPENKRRDNEKSQSVKANLFDDILSEPDKAILFALVLLLRSEEANEELIMSLLYIML